MARLTDMSHSSMEYQSHHFTSGPANIPIDRGYPVGRRTEMWDVSGRTRWTYDARGRITTEERWIDGQLYTTDWTYDSMDRVVTMTYPGSGTREVVTYNYNNQLLLSSMSGTDSYVSNPSYNAPGQPTSFTYGNGAVTTLGFDSQMFRLTSISVPAPVSLSLSYQYFPNGNVMRITEGSSTDFAYDELDRLKTANGSYSALYDYDKIGNITSKQEGSTNHSYVYPAAGHAHAPATVDGLNQGYDANGNLTARSGTDYRYDAENRLVKMSSDSGGAQYVARFAYDGDGKRVKRVDTYGTIHYVGPHYERNVGNGQSTAEVVTKYYYVQLGPYRRLIALRQNGTLQYLHTEHLGGTNILSDSSGNEVGALRYHSYGQTRAQTGSVPTDKKFTGQTLDGSTGLYYYGARYYDAAIGRFVQPDTIVPKRGNPQSLNRYSYVYNNPLKYIDRTGNYTEDELSEYLGEDWYDTYFAEGGLLEGRGKLLDMLRSNKTTDLKDLGIIGRALGSLREVHELTGLGVAGDVDAIGLRGSFSVGGGGYGSLGGEIVLNLTSGELSYFASADVGLMLGGAATVNGGVFLVRNLPRNYNYRGAFWNFGAIAAYGPGIAADYSFAPGPVATDKVGADSFGVNGVVGGGAGFYGAASFSLEARRVDRSGTTWFPDSLVTAVSQWLGLGARGLR